MEKDARSGRPRFLQHSLQFESDWTEYEILSNETCHTATCTIAIRRTSCILIYATCPFRHCTFFLLFASFHTQCGRQDAGAVDSVAEAGAPFETVTAGVLLTCRRGGHLWSIPAIPARPTNRLHYPTESNRRNPVGRSPKRRSLTLTPYLSRR